MRMSQDEENTTIFKVDFVINHGPVQNLSARIERDSFVYPSPKWPPSCKHYVL